MIRKLAYICILTVVYLSSVSCHGQIVQVSSDQAAPTAGTGHSYQGFVNSAVDPATGGVQFSLGTPVPGGLGPHVPFSFKYNSGSAFHLQSGIGWTDNTQYLGAGGWRYVLPMLLESAGGKLDGINMYIYPAPSFGGSPNQGGCGSDGCSVDAPVAFYAHAGPGGNIQLCAGYGNYLLEDPSGGTHLLPLIAEDVSCSSGGAGPIPPILSGGDAHYHGVLAAMATEQKTPPPLLVSDADGTIYSFSHQEPMHLSGANTGNQMSLLPDWISDRNGNKEVFTDSGNGAVKVTDSEGRSSIQTDGFGNAQDHITISGLANAYTVQWNSQGYAWKYPANILVSTTPSGLHPTVCGSFSSDTLTTIGPVNGGLPEITSIGLPNGNSYQFAYDSQYGLLSHISYPNGATVQYFWGIDSQNGLSSFQAYGSLTTNLPCEVIYGTPVVQREIISFDGQTPALERDYSYSTTWQAANGVGTTTSGGSFQVWKEKTTTVITRDLLAGTTYTTNYSYAPIAAPMPPLPNTLTSITGANPLDPVEQSEEIVDANNVALRLTTKTYYSEQLPPIDVKTTLENGQTAEVFHCYFGVNNQNTVPQGFQPPAPCHTASVTPFLQISDSFEYDFGNATITPQPGDTLTPGATGVLLRHSLVDYEPAIASPLSPQGPGIIDRPADQIVEDGSGNPVAKTQYFYDQSPLTGASASWHDDQHFPPYICDSRQPHQQNGSLLSGSHRRLVCLSAGFFSNNHVYLRPDGAGRLDDRSHWECQWQSEGGAHHYLRLSRQLRRQLSPK